MVPTAKLIAIWESGYPTSLATGMLKRQHMVYYYMAEVDEALLDSIKIQYHEVSDICWLSKAVVALLTKKYSTTTKEEEERVDLNGIHVSCHSRHGSTIGSASDWKETIAIKDMKAGSFRLSEIDSHLSEGSRFALHCALLKT